MRRRKKLEKEEEGEMSNRIHTHMLQIMCLLHMKSIPYWLLHSMNHVIKCTMMRRHLPTAVGRVGALCRDIASAVDSAVLAHVDLRCVDCDDNHIMSIDVTNGAIVCSNVVV